MKQNHILSIYLYTGNHSDIGSIQDFIHAISNILKINNIFSFCHGNDLNTGHDIYLYIEEFTQHKTRVKLRKFRERVSSPFIVVPTEFITQHKGQCTFNDFDYADRASPKKILRPFSRIYCKCITKDFGNEILLAARCLPLFLYWMFKLLIRGGILDTYREVRKQFYMDVRYLSYLSVLDLFDFVWPAHNDISLQSAKFFKYENILPTLKPLITSKIHLPRFSDNSSSLNIKMSGTLTPYRLHKLRELQSCFIKYKKQTLRVHLTGFNNNVEDTRQMDFTFNPPQTLSWKYCSPMRLFRSLEIEKCIPIITKNFKQEEIEALALDIDTIDNNHKTVEKAEIFVSNFPRLLNEYNRLAKKSAIETIDKLQSMLRSCSNH